MKQKFRIISYAVLTALIFALLAFGVSAHGSTFSGFTETENPAVTLSGAYAVVDGQKIVTSVANGETYLFLPSDTDLDNVTLGFNCTEEDTVWVYDGAYKSQVIGGETISVKDNAVYDAEKAVYTLTLRTVRASQEEPTLEYSQSVIKVMKSQGTAAMYISFDDPAYSRAWIDSSPNHSNDAGQFTTVKMALIEENSAVIYNNKLTQIKGRGNSTWLRPKKAYQIKLDKKTDLLSSGNSDNKSKTWILLANAIDKTLIKNAFAFDLARYFGLEETPEYRFIDLYFDGEYRGSYLLCEKIQINTGRVEINDLEDHTSVADKTAKAQAKNKYGCVYQYNPTAVCDTDAITGGYLLEHDDAFYATENSWFKTSTGNTIVIKSPECATKEQVEYISEHYNEMMLAAKNGKYNGVSVEEYVDINSFASIYLINEYMKNIDFGCSSTYFFLPEEGNAKYEHKFYAGPAWDFDTSLGNRIELSWMQDPDTVFRADLPYFRSNVVRTAIGEKAKELDSMYDLFFSEAPVHDDERNLSSLTYLRDSIYGSIKMNFTFWPCDNTENAFAYPTYEENFEYASNFLKTRHNLIISQIAAWATHGEGPVEPEKCDHICHKDGFEGFIYKICLFFWRLFGTNKTCKCGTVHYTSRIL